MSLALAIFCLARAFFPLLCKQWRQNECEIMPGKVRRDAIVTAAAVASAATAAT